MHAKREIPVSSCTSDIENILYGNGAASDATRHEEDAAFQVMLDKLDHDAVTYEAKPRQKIKCESRFHKKNRLNIHGGTWCCVDTDNKFWYGNQHYIINDRAAQYAPVETEFGEYYAMDKILVCDGKFYDMNYDEVEVSCIGGILKDLISVG